MANLIYEIDPHDANTPDEFVTRLRQVRERSGLSYRQITRNARDAGHVLPPSTLGNMLSRSGLPREDLLVAMLTACGGEPEAIDEWLAVRQRLAWTEPERLAEPPAPPTARATAPDPPTAPAQLPADALGFTGRDAALAHLDRILGAVERTPTAAVVATISGTAGVGKSALAVHWGHRVADRFPDGQLHVNLRGFDPGGRVMEPEEAVRGLLDGLGVAPERMPPTLDAQAALYRSLLANKRILIVLDNARDAEQVRPLLPGTPTAVTVVTSRDQLTPLVAVDGAQPLTLDILSVPECRELLTRRLGADRIGAEPQAADHIITACARLPLALNIAAARARQTGFPLAALAAELVEAGGRLDALDAGDATSQMRAVLSWSYDRLAPPAARLFRLLGLHPGPEISVPAAASLVGRSRAETRRLLADLTRASLVTEYLPRRYTFHDLLRAYAADLVDAHEPGVEQRAAANRVLDHYLHAAHDADRLLSRHRDPMRLPLAPPAPDSQPEHLADHRAAMAWLTTEHRVLLAALRQAADAGLDRKTWQLAWTLNTFLYRQGHWGDQLGTCQVALLAARRLGEPAAQADCHRVLGRAHTRLGRYGDAHGHLAHAIDLYTCAGDLPGQAQTHADLAYLWDRRGHPDRALGHAERSLVLYRADHHPGEAYALNGVGWHHALLGNYAEALVHCQQALVLVQRLGNRPGEAATWDSLGYAHHHLGHYRQAADCYQHALALRRDLGTRYTEATTLTHLGDTHHAAGDLTAARTAWREALQIFEELGHEDAARIRVKLWLDHRDGPRLDGIAAPSHGTPAGSLAPGGARTRPA